MSGLSTCEASRHSGFVPDLTHEQWARIDAAAVALLGQGSHLGIGESFASGESVSALRAVFMPVSGKVTSRSESLERDPA
jgi:glycine cleavage system H lipoate-binding protein